MAFPATENAGKKEEILMKPKKLLLLAAVLGHLPFASAQEAFALPRRNNPSETPV